MIFNCIFSGGIYLIIDISFSLIFQTTKFFHFAHAVIFTSGVYFAYLFNQVLGWPYYAAIPMAIILALLLGGAMESFIYKSLRKGGSSAIVLLLASLGIYIILQNLISLFFGDDTKSINFY
ncbi:MAG: hypothetical protein A2W11_00495 [Ignavibacteria bacterium RBG_16_35_7]|nr:MAG: hypothetical protein A2W11_00495 [Ignavibacteria bacterium RBG_16_35_7]